MQRVHDYIKEAGVYYLATVDGEQPRVRPFGVLNIFEDMMTKTQTQITTDVPKEKQNSMV